MIITTDIRGELLASGWAEPVTDPVRLDSLAHMARNERSELIAVLPYGRAYAFMLDGRKPTVEWWGLDEPDRLNPVLSSDLTRWAEEQNGPVRCWTT